MNTLWSDGVNDTPACAAELAGRLRGMLCHVNLIPANPVEGSGYAGSRKAAEPDSSISSSSGGSTATIRRTLGSDITASCGQLRRRKLVQKIHRGGFPLRMASKYRYRPAA